MPFATILSKFLCKIFCSLLVLIYYNYSVLVADQCLELEEIYSSQMSAM